MTSVDFLQQLKGSNKMMLAIVERKRQMDKTYVEIRVDVSNEAFLQKLFRPDAAPEAQKDATAKEQQRSSNDKTTNEEEIKKPPSAPVRGRVNLSLEFHVYFFDSMSTRVREFRTIRCAEFFLHNQIIFDPSLLPKLRMTSALDDVNATGSKKIQEDMKEFMHNHSSRFNQS